MKVQDLSPQHIGTNVRIEHGNYRVQGVLKRLLLNSSTPELTVDVAGFRLDLTGQETVTLLDGDQ